MEHITLFRKLVSKKFNTIPSWINSTEHLYYVLWQALLECNSILFKLIKSRVLETGEIIEISNDFDEYIQAIITNTEPHIHVKVSVYYITLLEDLIKLSENQEFYEVCHNLMKFRDLYFNNTQPNP